MNSHKLMKLAEAAEWLGVHPHTLLVKAASGEVHAVKMFHKEWRFIESDLLAWLRGKYQQCQLKERQGEDDNHVFTYAGRLMDKASTAGWYRAMKKANITGFTWHGLRHTWASYHVMNGTPLEVLKELGGWSSLEMVMRYSHLSPGHVASWAENSGTTSVLRHSEKQEPHE